ncbi:MAG TPA: hypothetical protein VE891_14015 [Allosphingosinicella sp.]|nr:hypothetical protein [Allosphingosinicella sp.]
MKHASVIAVIALLGSSPVLASHKHKTDSAAGKPDKVVCKRIVETGSLVRGAKTCKTRAQWDHDGALARRQVQDIQDASLINSSRPF